MASASIQSALGKKFTLSNGLEMPAVGSATFRINHPNIVNEHIDRSLSSGYRLFDTSAVYGNEGDLKHAFAEMLPKYDLDRSDIFITSKLVVENKDDYSSVVECLHQTLAKLGLDYVDLFLANHPAGHVLNRTKMWSVFQQVYNEGIVSAIGVVNYNANQLRELISACPAPMVNQVEWHPMMHNEELYDLCKENNVLIQGYCPFGSPFINKKMLHKNYVIQKIAKKYDVTPDQVILMWCLQRGVAAVPLVVNPLRLVQNINTELKLTPSELFEISGISPNPYNPNALM